jgi:hypothetical protein
MKKPTFKPGFEFIFSLSIIAILGLPPLVFAQTTKDLQITINNGDTTVNGKNIKDLSASDRKDALKNINQITVISSDDKANQPPMIVNDNMKHPRHLKIMKTDGSGKDSMMVFNDGMGNPPKHKILKYDDHFNRDNEYRMIDRRRNTQNFTYNNVDNDGVVTHVSYHVSEHPSMLDYDAGKQGDTQMDMLDLMDLTIVPEFASGKTLLMFSLPAKAVAEVQFKDSKGTLLWSAKASNGAFSKSFPLGLNGSYYLQVKQGGKVAVKKIEKE